MKIAVPVANGRLCLHFGHCEQFAIFEVDPSSQAVLRTEYLVPPPHEPGVLPRWLHEQGVTTVIAGGMGQRAQQLFTQNEIEVIVGALDGDPDEIVAAYLAGSLKAGKNVCDH